MTTNHRTQLTTPGVTPDGPRTCLHNAPIKADCLDCARELCEGFEQGHDAPADTDGICGRRI